MSTHFIGIGGIGVSALAKYRLVSGNRVSGSDLMPSKITKELSQMGVAITIGTHKKEHLPKDAEEIIYTAAVPKNNQELREAKKRKCACKTYAEAVGELTKSHKTITIAGTHGKSTTTALTALVLQEGHCDPTVIIGTKLKEFGNSNFRKGYGGYLVIEADEWNKSFLNYSPSIAAVTNIDNDHLDTYANIKDIENAFQEYLSRVPRDGAIVANKDDVRVRRIAKKFGKLARWYSLSDRDTDSVRRVLKLSGEHNVSNALAAREIGRALGILEPDILRALASFSGCWRRFEFKGVKKGAFLFSDYAHHPTAISATIKAARERFPFRRIWCVYQPHQYQRLAYLWNDFKSAFDLADRVCLLPVYDVAGREMKKAKKKVDSFRLAAALEKRGKCAAYQNSFVEAERLLHREARKGDVVLIMGAGDIYTWADAFAAIDL